MQVASSPPAYPSHNDSLPDQATSIHKNTQETSPAAWHPADNEQPLLIAKYWADGDAHKLLSAYNLPYDVYINFMNIYGNAKIRVAKV